MAEDKKAGAKAPAKPKKVFVTVDKVKYELLGGPNKKYIFQGETFNKETASKKKDLIASLLKSESPLLEKVES